MNAQTSSQSRNVMKRRANFLISLDFELFWGVAASRTLAGYGRNVRGEWEAIPKLLKMFSRYSVRATWATVGMLMCRNYSHWRDIRPAAMPNYVRQRSSPYALDSVVKENPKMFFARPLVEKILDTRGQEVGGHSYSHFYCMEAGVTAEQFSEDLKCAREVATDLGVDYRSFVFPRNQVRSEFLNELSKAGYEVFRGNPRHRLYSSGHHTIAGWVGRGARLVDAYMPVTGNNTSTPNLEGSLVNARASFFLRPWSPRLSALEPLRLKRLKRAMLSAAQMGEDFHIWWHPHNFGLNVDQNLNVLQSLLDYYLVLSDLYDMRSVAMGDLPAMMAS